MSLTDTELQLLNTLKNPDLELESIKDELGSIANNFEFMVQAYKVRPEIIFYVGDKLLKDKDFALALFDIISNLSPEHDFYYHPFPYLDQCLRDDVELVTMAVNQDVMSMEYASARLKSDEAFKEMLLKTNSYFPIIRASKVLKNTLLEGISDTFHILHGNHGIFSKRSRNEFHPNELKYGVLDILLFPLLAKKLFAFGLPIKPLGYGEDISAFAYSKDHENYERFKPFRFVATAIALGLSFIRLGAALLATLLLVPVIIAVHILKYPYVAFQQYRLLQMEGLIHSRYYDNGPTPATLKEYLERTSSTLSDLYGTNRKALGGDLIASSSKENTNESMYGNSKSRNPILFFKPSNDNSQKQQRAFEAASELEVMLPYEPNNFYSDPTIRTFY